MAATGDLDQELIYRRLDPAGMRGHLAGLPQQCRQAWKEGLAFSLPHSYRAVERVVLAGMGGSAVGGTLLVDLLAHEPAPAITVCRDYSLPRYVDQRSLVLISSYSGNTEETLSAFHQAVGRGCRVVCLTSGGRLGEEARQRGVPLFIIGQGGPPRTALGYSLLVPLAILQGLGLVVDKDAEVEETVELLRARGEELGEGVPLERNGAKTLARELQGRLTVVYGAGLLRGVAYRWKTQFNENAKAWAFAEELPELTHNSVVGYRFPPPLERLAVVMLSSSYLHPRTVKRYQVTAELLRQAGVPYTLVEGRGHSPLSHLLSCVLLGDYTSYYLALLNGVDPSPVEAIDYLKQRLAQP